MVWLPDGEKILKICLFILTESTNLMNRRIDGHRMMAKAVLYYHHVVVIPPG